MKIANKFLKDDVSIEEFANEFEKFCMMLKDQGILMTHKQEMQEFLNCKLESKLTDDERIILKNIDKRYKYIGRTDYNARTQYLFVNVEDGWKPHTMEEFKDDLFNFIKFGEEYEIAELLKEGEEQC